MNKVIVGLLLYISWFSIFAQLNNEAWLNFDKSIYQNLGNKENSDVTIIFDRTYININKVLEKNKSQVEVLTTIHRKTKINSLHGLEQYNKLYIPTINNLHFKLDFVNCKAKTLKKDKETIITDTSQFVNTTLPANTPFFYKVEGNVKMLALNDVNIGDEIEYVYSIKYTYDINPDYFYKTDRILFNSENYCMEKSLFLNADGYKIRVWPYNFNNGNTRKTNFTYKSGKKITLTNIKEYSEELYANSYLENPYLSYIIDQSSVQEEDTWETFTKDFKPRRSSTKKSLIFNGQSILNTHRDIASIKGIKNKYQSILDKINQPIQDNFNTYEDIKDDIDIAWTYAQVISKVLKGMNLPINFHFVKNKNYGSLDKSYVTLYQFDNIICSFIDDNNKTHYFPLLEPYSNLNDIKSEFQGTECYTIKQNQLGKRSYSFDSIPRFEKGHYEKEVNINFIDEIQDTLNYKVKESLNFTGHSWIELKPIISHIVRDSNNTIKNLKRFISTQLILNDKIDSIYNINFTKKDSSFNIDYQYDLFQINSSNSQVIAIKPSSFIENDYYTPYYLNKKRVNRGYFYNEFNKKYIIRINFNNEFKWIENNLLKSQSDNIFGNLKTNYNVTKDILNTTFEINYTKDIFEINQWEDVVKLRNTSYLFLKTNLYFKR